jgi:hypothetical protein
VEGERAGADVRSGEGVRAGGAREGPEAGVRSNEEAATEGALEGCGVDRVLEGADREALLLLSQLPAPGEARSGWELLRILKVLLATRQSLSWQTGRALAVMHWDWYYGDIGWSSFQEYVEQGLGIAEGRANTLRRLDRELHQRPPLRDAYRQGKLGWNKSWLVVKATKGYPEKVEAWVEHARRVTLRRLDMEVRALGALREISERRWWERTHGLPPAQEMLQELGMLPGGYRPPQIDALERMAGDSADVRSHDGPRRVHILLNPPSAIVFRAPPEVLDFFRRVVSGMKKLFGPRYGIINEERCLLTMMAHFAEANFEGDSRIFHLDKVYERDGWRCMFPGCGGRVLEDHHKTYQSAGGVSETWNRLSLCPAHHRHAVHGGRARVEGRAPDALTFKVGRREDGTFREVWRDDERVDAGPEPDIHRREECR